MTEHKTFEHHYETAIAELSRTALLSPGKKEFLDEAVLLIRETVAADLVELLEFVPVTASFIFRSGVGWAPGLVGEQTFPLKPKELAGACLRSAHPIVIKDFGVRTSVVRPPYLVQHNVVSAVVSAIKGVPRPFGVLGLHWIKAKEFDRGEIDFARAAGEVIAISLQLMDRISEMRELERFCSQQARQGQESGSGDGFDGHSARGRDQKLG